MIRRHRPIIDVPRSRLEIVLELIAALGVTGIVICTLLNWMSLPADARVPTHFDLRGNPDAYIGKASLLVLPCIFIVLYAFIAFISRYPHTFNYPWPITEENAPRQYKLARTLIKWINLEMVLIGLWIVWLQIQAAQQNPMDLIWLAPFVIVIAIFGTIIAYFVIANRAR